MKLAGACLLLTTLAGCGYVGDPLPPALNIPKPVIDLRVIERGPNLEVAFTMPTVTGEGLHVQKAGLVDLRVGIAPPPPFDINAWLANTREVFVEWPTIPPVVAGTAASVQTVTQPFDAADWAGKEVIIGVRLTSPSGRPNAMSNLVAISVIPPLAPPENFDAKSRADGIMLTWTAPAQPGIAYRITRQIGPAPEQTIADVKESQYLDLVTAFGPTYRYTIQSYVRAGDINAISEVSKPTAVEHKDVFAPAVPTGLAVLTGAKSIDLGWDRNTDADLAGYRIYRAVGDGPFIRIPGQVEPPSFRDAEIQTGQKYRYAVSAVDKLGNESARSEPAEAEAP